MQLTINGQLTEYNPPLSVAALVAQLALNPTQVAVERNRVIVPKSQYDNTDLVDGDQIEIVHFIGGG